MRYEQPDTIQMERLAWAVFDNIMGLGKAPPLSGSETYREILGHLAGKAYKGLHTRCPACTSASFGAGHDKDKTWRPGHKGAWKTSTLFHDARREKGVCGVILHSQSKARACGGK